MTFGSLFAGIGGFDLGFERAGMRCRWQVEADDDCTAVLCRHWPHVERHRDVRECGRHNLAAVDVVCGGFPCQPFSIAGESGRARRHESDSRNLWPEMRRIVSELRPTWVVGENVPPIVDLYLDVVLGDLEAIGYTAWAVVFSAGSLGTPQIRERVFIVAHSYVVGQAPTDLQNQDIGGSRVVAEVERIRASWVRRTSGGNVWLLPDSGVCRAFNDVPGRLDGRRFRMIGNAVPPIMAQAIAESIVAVQSDGG